LGAVIWGFLKIIKTKEDIVKKSIILILYSLLTSMLIMGMTLIESQPLIGYLMANIGILGIIGILIYSFRETIKGNFKKIINSPFCLSFFLILWGIILVITSVINYNDYPSVRNDFNLIILLGVFITLCGFLMTFLIITPQKTSQKY